MILPTKHISVENSLISISSVILNELKQPQTISNLWETIRSLPGIGTFERFSLALDLLYLMGAVNYKEGLIGRQN